MTDRVPERFLAASLIRDHGDLLGYDLRSEAHRSEAETRESQARTKARMLRFWAEAESKRTRAHVASRPMVVQLVSKPERKVKPTLAFETRKGGAR